MIFSRRTGLLIAVVATTLALAAGVAWALTGDLTYEGCFADTATAGCTVPSDPALDFAIGVTVSPDGNSVYVSSEADDSISHFTRDPSTGDLTYEGCFADTAADGCAVPAQAVLAGATYAAVSPDNKSVYVVSRDDSSLVHFTRDLTTGNLTYQGCFVDSAFAGCSVPAQAALGNPRQVAVSPDNKSVYVVAGADNSISHFTRDLTTGNLTYQGCIADTAADGCTVAAQPALNGAKGVAVSPDNKSVYVAAFASDSIARFDRDTSTGNLTYQDCFADATGGCAVPASAALDAATGVAVSPDNKSVYVASDFGQSVSHFTRDTSSGSLTFQGCFAETNADGCEVPAQAALDGARGVAVSPDNQSVYVASDGGASISHFTRDTSTGNLAFRACIADSATAGCAVPAQAVLSLAVGVAVSPDNKSVYVAAFGDDAVSEFGRELTGYTPPPSPPPLPPPNHFEYKPGVTYHCVTNPTGHPGILCAPSIEVTVPGPGELLLKEVFGGGGHRGLSAPERAKKAKIKPVTATAKQAGKVALKLKLTKAGAKALKAKRKLKLTAGVTFTPTGGTPNTQTTKVKLKLKQPKN